MATTNNPEASARICVGCLFAVSSCSCPSLPSPVVGSESTGACRCGRLTSAPRLRGLVEAIQATHRRGVAEGDPLCVALAGVGDPVVVELAASVRPVEASPRRVCLDCRFNDGRIASVVVHVTETKHRIDLALVESAREESSASSGPFLARLREALELGERQAVLLAGLNVDREAFQHGQEFATVLDAAHDRAKRQRDFLRSLVALLDNPGSRLALENGRAVVHVAKPVSAEEIGAVELGDLAELPAAAPPPVADDMDKTEIRRAPVAGEGVSRG